jgi:hypothetical protein
MDCRRGVTTVGGKKEEEWKRGACNIAVTEKGEANRKRKPGEKRVWPY